MAYRFIEMRVGENWRTVSDLFAEWVRSRAPDGDYGWSEGDSLRLPDGTQLACFCVPGKHGHKIEWFETWAKSTDRLYGIATGAIVQFPLKPEFSVSLPSRPAARVPPWLRGA
jgi:hypothetical protein